jgi:predicted lipoprotein
MKRHPALVLAIAFAAAATAALGACRKPPPFEVVYTGATSKGSGPSGSGNKPGEEIPVPAGFDKKAVLKAAGDCALGRYRSFEGTARALSDAAHAWGADPLDSGKRDVTRQAWKVAMANWSEAELFRFGPAAPSSLPGGEDLRDPIYPWPLVSRCRIEEQLVDKTYTRPEFTTSLVNGRGLSAIEYLAFYDRSDNACSSFSTINANNTWAALGTTEIARRKAEYAAAVADDVLATVGKLLRAWDPAGGNYAQELSSPGSGKRIYATDQDAFNALNEALFYMELTVKDAKIARPLGLRDCPNPTCPEAMESIYSRTSKEQLKANLVGFRRIFEGCADDGSGLAFDDLLRAVGADDLANRMVADLADIQKAVDELEGSLEDALASSPAKVQNLFTLVKKLTDTLKTEFVSVLNLELPKASEGDND